MMVVVQKLISQFQKATIIHRTILVEEIQNIIDRRYGTHLKQSNASITISYVKNSQRVEVHSQDPNQVIIFFPTPLAEK